MERPAVVVEPGPRSLLLCLVTAAASGVVYFATLAPTVASSRDSAELALAAITAGVPHPTGYPLYMLLGHLWVEVLPVGDPGWRLNLFSAVCSALAVALFAATLLRIARSYAAAWLGAMALAFSPVFWMESTVAEVYPLHMLLQSAVLWCWIRWEQSAGRHGLGLLVFALGLSFTHHLMTLLILPCVGLGLLLRLPRWWGLRNLGRLALLFVLPLGIYAYIPIALARSPEICWTDLSSVGELLAHVTGGGYGGALAGGFDEAFRSRLLRYPRGLVRQFGPLLLLVPFGLWALRRSPRVLFPTVAGYVGAVAFALSYQVIDPDAFYLPSCLFIGVWIAAGAAFVLRPMLVARPAARRTVAAAFLVLPGLGLAQNLAMADRSDDYRIYDRDMTALALADENAVLLVWGDSNFPLYASMVHGLRPDVEVLPLRLTIRCELPPDLRAIRAQKDRPEAERMAATLTAARRFGGRDRTLAALPVEAGSGWGDFGLQLREQGAINSLVAEHWRPQVSEPPWPAIDAIARFGDALELLELRAATAELHQGEVVELDYLWRPTAPVAEGTRIVTFLGDAEGPTREQPELAHRLGQGMPYEELVAGEVLRERIALRIPYELPPGEWTLWVGVATPKGPIARAAGELRAPAGRLRVRERPREPWQLPTVHRVATRP